MSSMPQQSKQTKLALTIAWLILWLMVWIWWLAVLQQPDLLPLRSLLSGFFLSVNELPPDTVGTTLAALAPGSLTAFAIACYGVRTSSVLRVVSGLLATVGPPLAALGIIYEIDNKLDPLAEVVLPFPGWTIIAFAVGSAALLHGLFLASMPGWRRSYKAIDYAWYSGALISFGLLATIQGQRMDEIAFHDYMLANYALQKQEALENLTRTYRFCNGTGNDSRAKDNDELPSEILCRLIEAEVKMWQANVLLNTDDKFDIAIMHPALKHTHQDNGHDLLYGLYASRLFQDSDFEKNGRFLCLYAEEEWAASGFRSIAIEDMLFPPPVTAWENNHAGIGNRSRMTFSMVGIPPPHDFAREACRARRAAEAPFRTLAGRNFRSEKAWMADLWAWWPFILSLAFATRLLKTTREVFF
ncbi:MAG: hypothetical protein AAFR71_01165 [Pseudomonadota bacterium]